MTIRYDWTENSEWIKTLIVDEEDKIIIHLSHSSFNLKILRFGNNVYLKTKNNNVCITKSILILEYAYAYLLSTSIKTFLPRSL